LRPGRSRRRSGGTRIRPDAAAEPLPPFTAAVEDRGLHVAEPLPVVHAPRQEDRGGVDGCRDDDGIALLQSRVYVVYWGDESWPAFDRERRLHLDTATL
jgi:hypothetical protein